jgi:hypothetical protein
MDYESVMVRDRIWNDFWLREEIEVVSENSVDVLFRDSNIGGIETCACSKSDGTVLYLHCSTY